MDKLDFADIQGLVVRGYGTLPCASYLLLEIADSSAARQWLAALATRTTFADRRPAEQAINLALTAGALERLHIEPAVTGQFATEFLSGMTTTHKQRILGDLDESSPKHWLWGGPETRAIDILLLCYATTDTVLDALCEQLITDAARHGLDLVARLETTTLPDQKEHFGFRDSIGQPWIDAFSSSATDMPDSVALGEVLLGYRNGYDRFTQRPLVPAEQDPQNALKPDVEGSGSHDLGLNGSYLVLRQLSQDVAQFWRAMKDQAATQSARFDDPIQVAAKLVGRWPSGTPLVMAPDQDDPDIQDKDNFSYHGSDALGHKCPLGAHIRRTNPRDSLPPEPGSADSVAFANRHRLLRRGRAYGEPFDASLDPEAMLQNLDRESIPVSRGLHFICINANIGRQFEFVQHTWSNNPNFDGLYRDPDPIVGTRPKGGNGAQFTVQGLPMRCQLRNLPQFVTTRGGAYFFLPSRRAMTYLFSPASVHSAETLEQTESTEVVKHEPHSTPS